MPHTIVIFGASGDLTQRKLVPALFRLYSKDRLPAQTRIVGFSRSRYRDEEWRAMLGESTARFVGESFSLDRWNEFARSIHYLPGDIDQPEDFRRLGQFLSDEVERGEPATRVYYLATAPAFYESAIVRLGAEGLAQEDRGLRRIVVEKPFGVDLATARRLNQTLHSVFRERQVYRIDHYLGKETVQNILVLRFANAIFEPIWNRRYIDRVEITAAEEVPVGRRGAYYDTSGVLRDMFQNHLLQLLTITAMESPARFEADTIRNEKVKVLQAIRVPEGSQIARDTCRGQYIGYRDEPGVAPDSQTATFAALKLHVDSWRWQGVPFFLRSGKAMSCRSTQIVIQFHEPPLRLFGRQQDKGQGANRLVIQVQPAEGLQLYFETKVPDAGMKLRQEHLEFRFDRNLRGVMPEAYERLLLDTLQGDASLFARSDEVETAWGIIDPILQGWASAPPPLHAYEPGGWGPPECGEWMALHGHEWFDACPVLS